MGTDRAAVVTRVRPLDSVAATAGFDAFYALHYRAMVRLAVLLVDEHGRAEEVTQDAFAKVYERWDRLDDPRAYLRASVVNRSRDVLRRRRVTRGLPVPRSTPLAGPAEPLDDALGRLSPRQRTALVLRYYEDLSVEAIAEAMGTRQGTVKSLIHRGLAGLREVIDQ
jgi:RNA polymerase sigma-70 factor (sigma-E family)